LLIRDLELAAAKTGGRDGIEIYIDRAVNGLLYLPSGYVVSAASSLTAHSLCRAGF
jgi:hypothetical protein